MSLSDNTVIIAVLDMCRSAVALGHGDKNNRQPLLVG